jgi:hypothetical protein
MARILAQHGIEQFVYFWLNKFRNDAEIRRERRYMEKAIKQLEFFLNPPCCVDPDATIEFRRLDNDLTRFIAAQIAQGAFDRRKWKKSLERAIDALQLRLDGCCTPPCPSPYPEEVNLPDAEEGTPYFTTIQLVGTGVFQIQVQQIPDGLSATVDPNTGVVTIQGTPTGF